MCYLALYNAVQSYDENSGYELPSYFDKSLKRVLLRDTGIYKKAPMPCSGDMPLDEDDPDGDTLLDTVSDTAADLVYERLIERCDYTGLHEALGRLADDEQDTVTAIYWRGMKQAEYAAEKGVTPEAIKNLQAKAIRNLRKDKAIRAMINEYSGTGLTIFRYTFTSATERLAIKLME